MLIYIMIMKNIIITKSNSKQKRIFVKKNYFKLSKPNWNEKQIVLKIFNNKFERTKSIFDCILYLHSIKHKIIIVITKILIILYFFFRLLIIIMSIESRNIKNSCNLFFLHQFICVFCHRHPSIHWFFFHSYIFIIVP